MKTEVIGKPVFHLDRLEKSLYNLSEVYRKHQQYIKIKYKMTSLEMEIIQFVILNGPQKMKEIGKQFNMKLSTLTSTVDKIENQKLVRRINSKTDRRVVLLEATRKGSKLYDSYSRYIHLISQNMRKNMEEEHFAAFMMGIEKMSEAVEALQD